MATTKDAYQAVVNWLKIARRRQARAVMTYVDEVTLERDLCMMLIARHPELQSELEKLLQQRKHVGEEIDA